MAVQLQTFLGVSMSLGSAFFGLVVLSKSKQCVISRRYLVQASMFGIGEQPTFSSVPPSLSIVSSLGPSLEYLG